MLGGGPLPRFLVGHTFQKSHKCHTKNFLLKLLIKLPGYLEVKAELVASG